MPEMSDSALRVLLTLLGLTFQYDTEKASWAAPDRSFSRREIEAACGLSGQGTRNGLTELEETGYVSIDRSGKSYAHTLEIGVPTSRYTYLPDILIKKASELSGMELRMVLTVLRATWGWTGASGGGEPTHKRWARLSTGKLAERTGRSASAVKTATQSLCGTLLTRCRPDSGAYYYRLSVEGLRALKGGPDESASTETLTIHIKKKVFFSAQIPNDLPPNRQQSAPLHRKGIESLSERKTKHSASSKQPRQSQTTPNYQNTGSAVRKKQNPKGQRSPASGSSTSRKTTSSQESNAGSNRRARSSDEEINLTGFSEEKRALGQKLANVGLWARCIPELLGRFSADRIAANFELFRSREPEIDNNPAFLRTAITEGYATGHHAAGSASSGDTGTSELKSGLPEPGTKVTGTRKKALLEAGLADEEDFDRFAHRAPGEKQHFFRVEKSPSRAARV